MISLWLLRSAGLIYYVCIGNFTDVVIFIALSVWKIGLGRLSLLATDYVWITTQTVVIAALWLTLLRSARDRSSQAVSLRQTGIGRPLLFPCETTHTRLCPKKHSFTYSYLMVGIPVGWTGVAGGMISVDELSENRKGWYTINAADYLARGNGHLGLRRKLDQFLTTQAIDPLEYPFAYLVTAAKFLGYHFNPVSFWYLYSERKRLTAIILEVNNTFGERRMYFLAHGGNQLENAHAEPTPLKQTWPKDFHVSPFNSRKGTYSLIAQDPLALDIELLNNTINLSSSKDHAKLIARIFSVGEAIDPTEMSSLRKVTFLMKWWWVGFMTFPRIVKEAGALYFKRQLHVWYRPEPLKESISRQATATECELEIIFRRYLRYLVAQSAASFDVQYFPAGIPNSVDEQMLSAAAEENPQNTERLEIKVLTPAFYTRFVYYAHDFEAMFCEFRESCTIWISNPQLLPKLVIKKPLPPLNTASYSDYCYFTAIKNMRHRPEIIQRPLTSKEPVAVQTSQDIRAFRLSSMDGYVLGDEDDGMRQRYRHLVLKLFITDYIAAGSTEVLWFETLLFRIMLSWVFVMLCQPHTIYP
ncbi:hypothetical protein GGR57DRAFT_492632 [Xylariaceae sp. FL1272]|nr:hypothetical protein GGR57DRAFT_492632 [Xylariaceae sp. FL1272]